MKHQKHLEHTSAASEKGRECEVQSKKPAPGLATPDLVMYRAEVERCGDTGVDSGHDLLVGNGGVSNTLTWRETEHDATRDGAQHGGRRGVARCGMGAPPRGGSGRAASVVSRDE